eukprot:m51a1_g3847 hypothetical protein (445) ;mRNA; f:366702-368209
MWLRPGSFLCIPLLRVDEIYRIEDIAACDKEIFVALRLYVAHTQAPGLDSFHLGKTLHWEVRTIADIVKRVKELPAAVATQAEAAAMLANGKQMVDYVDGLLASRSELLDAGVAFDSELWSAQVLRQQWQNNGASRGSLSCNIGADPLVNEIRPLMLQARALVAGVHVTRAQPTDQRCQENEADAVLGLAGLASSVCTSSPASSAASELLQERPPEAAKEAGRRAGLWELSASAAACWDAMLGQPAPAGGEEHGESGASCADAGVRGSSNWHGDSDDDRDGYAADDESCNADNAHNVLDDELCTRTDEEQSHVDDDDLCEADDADDMDDELRTDADDAGDADVAGEEELCDAMDDELRTDADEADNVSERGEDDGAENGQLSDYRGEDAGRSGDGKRTRAPEAPAAPEPPPKRSRQSHEEADGPRLAALIALASAALLAAGAEL